MEQEVNYRRAMKRRLVEVIDSGDAVDNVYRFKVLFPNGTSIGLTLRDPNIKMPLEDFIGLIKEEYFRAWRQSDSMKKKRKINWKSDYLFLEDANDFKISNVMNFKSFTSHKCHILRLHDGSGSRDIVATYENMWDLTPDTELLMELPEEYSFETALADLIDNSLQAVWCNRRNDRRMICVDIHGEKISIFDTGPGMDESEEKSIVKWGKMGASLHRSSKLKAIGGEPPYLTPFFGMFGYGGSIASMYLGRRAIVSSKTMESKKVYILHLDREALLNGSCSGLTWKTNGGIRDPSEDEMRGSPHQSFTKVEIFQPKMNVPDSYEVQCRLKDIYFPYIQCDEVSKTGMTSTPIEFKVNGVNLAEIEGGQVAVTNLHTCNGPDFVLQLRFSIRCDNSAIKSPRARTSEEANARLKCVYLPNVKGKENVERVLEQLEADGYGLADNFDKLNQVSIRRLGRLLPDARWGLLPFMESKHKKGDKAHIMKRCCPRVKCFIDTDARFNPTPSKTDLAHHSPFTIALKNFGKKPLEKEQAVGIEVSRAGKMLTLYQLEREYQEWIFQMHDCYDEEIDSGEDQPVLLVNPGNKKALGISSDVVRVHQTLKRKGVTWRSGQKIKIIKGACAGCHKNNVYASLEYFLLEGLRGDAGGEARLICRPLGLPDENGCILSVNGGDASIDIRESLSIPISVIDSGKCLAIESIEWDNQLEKQRLKAPSAIDLLNASQCQELKFDGALPTDASVRAGQVPPREIVAILLPANSISSNALKNLDLKSLCKSNLEMYMELNFKEKSGKLKKPHQICLEHVASSSLGALQGLYVFPIGREYPNLFEKAGVYTFSFFLDGRILKCEKTVVVEASSEAGCWKLQSDGQTPLYTIRVGSSCSTLRISSYDIYDNQIPFKSIPKVNIKLLSDKGLLVHANKMRTQLSNDKFTLQVKDILFLCDELDKIRPSYEASLVIITHDELFSVSIPCQVAPGSLHRVMAKPLTFMDQLLPGCVIEQLVLEMFDMYGNHVREGLKVQLDLNGLNMQDQTGRKHKVDSHGYIDLSGLLKVTAGYGKSGFLSVSSDKEVIFKQEFQTEIRELRLVAGVPKFCIAGTQLENIVYEIVNLNDEVDESIHHGDKYGHFHTLTIKSETTSVEVDDSIHYSFKNGRCTVPFIPVPQNVSRFCFKAVHSRYTELQLSVEVLVIQAPKEEIESPKSDVKVILQNLSPLLVKEKELENGVCRIGEIIGKQERDLSELHVVKADIEREISEIQAFVEPGLCSSPLYIPTTEEVKRQIESNDHSAAAIVSYSLSSDFPFKEKLPVKEDILGVVALLGRVPTNELSRILAEYLGDDQMLAVVCKSFRAATALEKYEQNGEIDHRHALHSVAVSLKKSIRGRFLVMCLEDMRPYPGKLKDFDPQRKLALPDPTLPNLNAPTGFVGYAVNVIDLDNNHINTRTDSGHGLRETLLYCLFGEVQVYQTREHMMAARACIKRGAVSLDGGIVRENGVICLGCGNPQIYFPVVTSEIEIQATPLKKIMTLQSELENVVCQIGELSKSHNKSLRKFEKKKEKHSKFIGKLEPFLKELYISNMENDADPPPTDLLRTYSVNR